MAALFETCDLSIRFDTADGPVEAVRGVSLSVDKGDCLALVGASGSGKSQTCLGALGLLAANGRASGSARLAGAELVGAAAARLRALRARHVGFIFQDPLTALTPHLTLGDQMIEGLRLQGVARAEALERARLMLERCRIPEAGRRLAQYPHELSGGMRQRVMIAQAILTGPDLLIADEPTTALDVTVQAQVLTLLRNLQQEEGMALILISHDMGVVAGLADRVAVMVQGRIVEQDSASRLFRTPKTEVARGLLGARRFTLPPAHPHSGPAVLQAHKLKVRYPIRSGLFARQTLRALDGVDVTLRPGETLGIIGESGCGKSTLARALLGLAPVHAGSITLNGAALDADRPRAACRAIQLVFQDPLASLDPRRTLGQTIAEPLEIFAPELRARDRQTRAQAMMEQVGLDPAWINRYPHELSGGQNQRAGIARALISQPDVVIADEAVSALDSQTQQQVLTLLRDLQRDTGVALLFITHDLAVARALCDRVMVLFLGREVESGSARAVLDAPCHPYTQLLAASVPVADPEIQRTRLNVRLTDELPSPIDSRSVMRYNRTRMIDDPAADQPAFAFDDLGGGHRVARVDALE